MNSKSLSQIVSQVGDIETQLIESGGVITEAIEGALAVYDTHLPDKIDSYASIIERFDLVEQFYKDKAAFYMGLSKSAASVTERCKENLKSAMKHLCVTELVGNDVKYKLSPTNPSAIIDSEEALDSSYKITETIVKIDKKKILEDMKLGVPVVGARMQENFRLTKSANRGSK
jgi:hypothetical protein